MNFGATMRTRTPSHSDRRRTGGVTLIEVLVALVILSLGLLGVLRLQLLSKQNNRNSLEQTIAAQLAYDMLERMRSNNDGNALLAYLNTAGNGLGGGQQGAEPNPDCSGSTAQCSNAQLAIHDVWLWERNLDGYDETLTTNSSTTATGGLINPTACLSGPIGGGSGIYTLVIAWRSGIALPQDSAVDCGLDAKNGAGQALYGDSGEYRRTARFTAYIAQK